MTSFFSEIFKCCRVERKDNKYEIAIDTTSPNISPVSSPMKKTFKKGTVNSTNLSILKTETTLSYNKRDNLNQNSIYISSDSTHYYQQRR